MPEEFTPNASVDFEAIAAEAAATVNGDGPHYAPPPDPPEAPARPRAPRPSRASEDPFAAIDTLVGEQSLMFRELGDINAKLSTLQLQTILMFGSALLLAVVVWKFARANAAP